jgi:hypothetical protein
MNTWNIEMTPEELKEKKENTATVIFTKFALSVGQCKDGLFCFFEGYDSDYYLSRLIRFCKDDIRPFNCQNKKGVLHVHYLIKNKEEYNKYKKGYFIDRDYDESIIGQYDPPIYETPCYSIENLYCSKEVFKKILLFKGHLFGTDADFNYCMELYEARQEEFHNATLLLNAWCACIRIEEVKMNVPEKDKLKLRNPMPPGIVNISLEEVTPIYTLEYLNTEFSRVVRVDEGKLMDKIAYLEKKNKLYVFRGKFELHFLIEFLKLININLKPDKVQRYFDEPINIHIDRARILNYFSDYAETPASLEDYIKSIVN